MKWIYALYTNLEYLENTNFVMCRWEGEHFPKSKPLIFYLLFRSCHSSPFPDIPSSPLILQFCHVLNFQTTIVLPERKRGKGDSKWKKRVSKFNTFLMPSNFVWLLFLNFYHHPFFWKGGGINPVDLSKLSKHSVFLKSVIKKNWINTYKNAP